MSTDTVKILYIPVVGPAEVREVPGNLGGLTEAIGGGWLEPIYPATPGTPWMAYLDEEGKIKGLPINNRATRFAEVIGWHGGDVLCGPVIFLGSGDANGDETDVDDGVLGVAQVLGLLPVDTGILNSPEG